MSLLCDHVRDVVEMRAEKQMSRVHAQPNIALVQDPQPNRNCAMVDLPRNAVNVILLPFVADFSVSCSRRLAKPEPAAAIRLWNRKFFQPLRHGCVAANILSSHDRGPFARVVRAGARVGARPGSPFYSTYREA